MEYIADFGLSFGILFQLRDDLLDGENTAEAQALLPEYLEKTLDSLKLFPDSETLEALRELTLFCAKRKE
jgi:geranylgeranyl pyrophosphate synthase